MSDDSGRELTPQEKAALIAWHLAHGEAMTTRQVAELTKMTTTNGAYQLMVTLSRVLPVYQDDDGFWQVTTMRELS